ncbi:zinc-ribbon domain-containing protein [Lysinibacillus sp. NPDC093712]|uniref:zinc-ribbon domain-containing protein n=1 Tax=Lysinibacillus sp. NPDC093712 TaxID=3390579 RepID=UPI003D053B1F
MYKEEKYTNIKFNDEIDLNKVSKLKNNAMLKHSPHLFEEWDFEKNDELGLDVYKVTKGSDKKAWWNCPKCKSSYQRNVELRTRGQNCPYCHGKMINHTNSLATKNPTLAKEWHPIKNGDLTPHDVTKAGRNLVWWTCSLSHEWQATIGSRSKGNGCPYCSGQKVNNTNSLATLNPQLSKEWNLPKNGNLTPHDVTCGSKEKVWWKCNMYDNHEWVAEVYSRNSGKGCPYCSGRKVSEINSLATLRPDLAQEWHPTKNGHLSIHDITSNSGNQAWWIGDCGHEWLAKISNRNTLNSKCPYCSNSKVLKGFNDMWTTNPELASLLNDPEDGYKYTFGTDVKLDWVCRDCGDCIKNKKVHQMQKQNIRCNSCSDGFSFPERVLYHTLRELSTDFIYELTFTWSQGKRYDFYIPSYKMIIEVHGEQHYEETGRGRLLVEEQENDRLKEQLAKENGIDLYIVIDARYSEFDYIKKNIIDSRLLNIFNADLNWNQIFTNSQKSVVFEAIEMWNKGYSVPYISSIIQKSRVSTSKYLSKGVKMNLCNYTTKESTKRSWEYRKIH